MAGGNLAGNWHQAGTRCVAGGRAGTMDACANCGSQFERKGGGYRRQSLTTKLRGSESTPLDVLCEAFGADVTLTPKSQRFLCHICANAASSAAVSRKKSRTAEALLKSASKDGTYLKRKLDFNTPTKPHKRQRGVLSTPVKRTTCVVKNVKVIKNNSKGTNEILI